MPTSASPHSRLSSPNELSQPSPLPKALPLPAAGLFCIPSVLAAVKLGSTAPNGPLFPSPEDRLAALATKLAHLLRLTRYPRTHPRFMKNRRTSTCGFVFSLCGMVGDGRLNVVDGPISWRADHAAACCASCRSVFRWVGILSTAIQAGMRRYPNAG